MHEQFERRLPAGAEPGPAGTHFRIWAPKHRHVSIVIDDADATEYPLTREADGWFSGSAPVAAGTRYLLRPGNGQPIPDPASRFQPDGPHGPSAVIDPAAFRWSDQRWPGLRKGRQVIYEMHIGTFTPEGTWSAAAARLPDLEDLGVTILEILPSAEFAGRFNWGYDGVAPFAPAHVYGTPDDMRSFIDRAHAHGLAVILDVVYNHMGPDGCYLRHFADDYFSAAHTTDWGPAINFDGPASRFVREFFLANVEYWIREFHLDGLRFDATQNIYDAGPRHILEEMTTRARAAAGEKRIWIVAENEPQDTRLVRGPEHGGFGIDAMWNDDFHHTAMVALVGVAEAYYTDYHGTAQELISCARHGFLYQGQHYSWQRQPRGTPTRGVPASSFVNFIQNHDQVANSAAGRRIHQLTSPQELRAMTALLLLMPCTPMLFQGQEFAASAPFLYFADHTPDLADRVRGGRKEHLAQFRTLRLPDVQAQIAEPASLDTYRRCCIDHGERDTHVHVLRLHRDLIALSRTDPVFSGPVTEVDGAVLGDRTFALRYRGASDDDRLLIVNLGSDLRLATVPEPLLAPPAGARWAVRFSTEDLRYGGQGVPHPELASGWLIQARSAVVLGPDSHRQKQESDAND